MGDIIVINVGWPSGLAKFLVNNVGMTLCYQYMAYFSFDQHRLAGSLNFISHSLHG